MNLPLQTMGDLRDILSEEASEIIKERIKQVRFPPGSDTYEQWVGKKKDHEHLPPRDRWVQEIGDFLYVLDLLMLLGHLNAEELGEAKARKRIKMVEMFGNQADARAL